MAINKSMLLVGTILAAGLAPGLAGTALAQATASPFTSAQRFDAAGRVTGTISPDPDGAGPLLHRATRNTYDAAGRLTKVETGTLSSWKSEDVEPSAWGTAFAVAQTQEIAYDAMDRKVKESISSGGTIRALTQYSYDAVGRLECTAVRMNPTIFATITTAACTLGTQGSGANAFGPDRITRNYYDAAGQVTQVRRGVGSADQVNETSNSYTPNGRLATLTDAAGNRTSFDYDGHDRLSKTRFPSPTTDGVSSATDYEQLTYEVLAGGTRTSDLVASRRLRDNQAIASAYDALGRVTLKNLPGSEPDVTYTYDLLGRMLSATQSGHVLSFTYDPLGRNLTQVSPLGTVTSQYDAGGRRTRLTYAGAGLYVDYDYLVTGEVTRIRENGATTGIGVLATYTYDNLGRRTGITRGNGTSASYSYDGVSRMTQLAENLAGTASDLTLGFTHNPASQIASDIRSNDAFSVTPTLSSRTDTHNGLNQVTAIGATAVNHTDARGNVTAIGSSAYGYSAENRLTSAPGSVTLAYDPMLRLYQTVGGGITTRFAYDGTNMIAEYNASNTLQRRFVHGPGVDEPLVWYEGATTATRRWFHADERGSVIAISDSAGNLHGTRNRYDDYGAVQGTLTGRFGYTGQAWIPEAGLWYFKARMYNPTLGGRFMQTDPLLYVDGPNPYTYAHNDPINLSDPTGMLPPTGRIGNCGPDPTCVTVVGAEDWGESRPRRPDGDALQGNLETRGFGHNGGPPLEESLVGRIFRGVLNKIGGAVAMLVDPAPAGPEKEGIGGAVLERGTQVRGRFAPTAEPGSILYRMNNGRISTYQVYGTDGLPIIRVDLIGRAHGGIPTPHTVEYVRHVAPNGRVYVQPGRTRPASWFELTE